MQYIEHTSIFLDLSKYSKHETAPFWAILYINFFASSSFLHWIGLRLSSKNTKALSFLTQLFSFSGEITSHVCFASILTFLVFVVIVCEPRCRLRTTGVEKSVAFTLLTLLPIPTQSQSSSLQTWIGRCGSSLSWTQTLFLKPFGQDLGLKVKAIAVPDSFSTNHLTTTMRDG